MRSLRLSRTENITTMTSPNHWFPILLYSSAWDLNRWKPMFSDILNSKSFWLKKCEKDFKYKFTEIASGKWKATEKFNDKTGFFKKIFKSSVFDDPETFYFSHYDEQEKMPFIPLNPGSNVKLLNVNVEMINSDFETFFNIDQIQLTEILRSPPYNLFVKFDPLNYPGVNIKYLCTEPADNKKECSILVFRTGQVIITGGTCETHLQNAYNFINGIFKQFYNVLCVTDRNCREESNGKESVYLYWNSF